MHIFILCRKHVQSFKTHCKVSRNNGRNDGQAKSSIDPHFESGPIISSEEYNSNCRNVHSGLCNKNYGLQTQHQYADALMYMHLYVPLTAKNLL